MKNDRADEWLAVHDREIIYGLFRRTCWQVGGPVVLFLVALHVSQLLGVTSYRPSFVTDALILGVVAYAIVHMWRRTRIEAALEISRLGLRWQVSREFLEVPWSDVVAVIPDRDRVQVKSRSGKSVQIHFSAVSQWLRIRELLEEGTSHIGWLPQPAAGPSRE